MRVLVTGGAGFIGQAVCRRLESHNLEPVIVDRAHGIDILTDPLPPGDAVIHLAGVLGTAELFDMPDTAVEVNVKGTLRVLEWCQVDQSPYVGISMPSVWSNVYQATKHCARQLAEAYGIRFDFQVSHVTAFNVYGPGQHLHGVQKILPTFSDRSWRGEPMPVWGPGTQKVDLVHVDDVARVMVDALKNGGEKPHWQAGSGHALTVLEIARMVGEVTGRAVVDFLPLRPGETNADGVVADQPDILAQAWADPRFAECVEWYKEPRP